jgi:hypothetical protein
MFNRFFQYLIPAAILIAALYIGAQNFFNFKNERIVRENSVTLLESVKTVSKLITVEGYFSELYDYKDYKYYDISLMRKKALLKVKAKVSVGYDLRKMRFEVHTKTRKLIITDLPQPEILSVDTDVSYYDIQEGALNSFTPDELTQLNKNARAFIEQKARASNLIGMAAEQGKKSLELIDILARDAGFTVEYAPDISLPADTTASPI